MTEKSDKLDFYQLYEKQSNEVGLNCIQRKMTTLPTTTTLDMKHFLIR